jgi:hypothetical protein
MKTHLNPDDLRLNDDIQEVLIWRTDKRPKNSADRHIGCPLAWFDRAYAAVDGKAELAVALFLYRERMIKKTREVSLSNVTLKQHGISRRAKYEAFRKLEAAGLIMIERKNLRALKVKFKS